MTLVRLLPIAAQITIASTRLGKPRNMSVTRIMISSIMPP